MRLYSFTIDFSWRAKTLDNKVFRKVDRCREAAQRGCGNGQSAVIAPSNQVLTEHDPFAGTARAQPHKHRVDVCGRCHHWLQRSR